MLRHGVFLTPSNLTMGLLPDTMVEDQMSTDSSGIHFLTTGMRTRGEVISRAALNPPSGNLITMIPFLGIQGDFRVILVTDLAIYDYANGNYLDITPEGYEFDNLLELPWSHDTFGGSLLFSNREAGIFRYQGNEVEYLDEGLSSTIIRSYGPYAVILGTKEDGFNIGQRVRWSDIGNPKEWWGETSGFVDLVDTPDDIVAAEPLGNSLVIYKRQSIHMLDFLGGVATFRISPITTGVGAVSPKAVVNMGDHHIFMSRENVYMFNGSPNLEPIGDSVKAELFRDINFLYSKNIYSLYSHLHESCFFFVPKGESEYPGDVWEYKNTTQSWSRHNLGGHNYKSVIVEYDRGMTIAELEGTILDLEGPIAQLGDPGLDTIGFLSGLEVGDQLNTLFVLDGGNEIEGSQEESYWVSKEFTMEEEYITRKKRFLGLEIDYKGAGLIVEYSVDAGDNWTTSYDLLTATHTEKWHRVKIHFDESGETLKIRFKQKDGKRFEIRWFNILWELGGVYENDYST